MEFQIHDLKSNRNVFRTLIIVETIVVCYFQWQLKNRSSERIVSNGVILLFLGGCILAAGVAAVVLFNERDYMNYIKVRMISWSVIMNLFIKTKGGIPHFTRF